MYLKFNGNRIANFVAVKYKNFIEEYTSEATTLESHHWSAETGTSGIMDKDDNSVNL
jgi:hypothetical protein